MNKTLQEKAAQIKIIITDVDGVLSDGGIIYDNNFLEYKRFQVKDGFIIKPLKSMGFTVGVITGRASDVVRKRCEELGFDFHYHGKHAKKEVFEKIMEDYHAEAHQIAYIGDDWIDLPVLMRCGLSAAPADAMPEVIERVDLVLEQKGGEGAFRAFAHFILKAQGKLETLLKAYI